MEQIKNFMEGMSAVTVVDILIAIRNNFVF